MLNKKTIKNYRDLIVWQKSMALVQKVYLVTKAFPKDEAYGLTQQIRRAAVSIPANVAEGHARNGKKEFFHFLGIAKGSTSELQTHLFLSEMLGYIPKEKMGSMVYDAEEITRLLNGLLNSLYPAPRPLSPFS